MCLILVVGVFIIRVQYSIRDDTRRQMASPDQTAPHHFQLEPRDWRRREGRDLEIFQT